MINIKNITILLVEDEIITAIAEKIALEKYGYSIVLAHTCKDAIETVDDNSNIDLILMDINLGEQTDGAELAKVILKEHEIPVVFLSNHSEPEIIKTTEEITSYGYVLKNSGIAVLEAAIKTALKLFGTIKQLYDDEVRQADMERNGYIFKEDEMHYRSIFENAGSGIIVIEEDTTISLVNKAFAESFGCLREEIENKKKFTDMVYKDDIAFMIREHYLRRDEPEKAKSAYEFKSEFKNNELRNYLLIISMIPGTKKSIATVMDITDRKEAEAVYRIAEKKYRNLFMNSQMGIFVTALDTGLVLDANDCFAWNFGFKDRNEMLDAPVYAESFYIDKTVRKKMVRTLKKYGKIRNYEAQFKRKDGSLFWIRYSIRLVDERGWIEGVSEDITDLRRAEAEKNIIYNELLTSERKYRLIFENSPLGLLHFDKNGIITDCNTEFEKIIGSHWSPVAGLDLLKQPHRIIISAVASALNGTPGRYEGVYQFARFSRERFFSAQFEAIYDENGIITGGIGIVEDITIKRAVQRTMLDELENERSRIGRILHDSLGQKLGAVLYLAQACSIKYGKTGILSDYDMEQLIDLSSSALEETRYLSRGLDNSIIDLGGFLDSLNEIVVRIKSIYGIAVDLEVSDALEQYDKIKLVNLYYIILESINNSIRHGKAEKVLLRYHTSEKRGFFTITSCQKKAMKYDKPGMGMRIMKYRAEVSGMEFSITSMNKTVSVIVALGDEPLINKNSDNPAV